MSIRELTAEAADERRLARLVAAVIDRGAFNAHIIEIADRRLRSSIGCDDRAMTGDPIASLRDRLPRHWRLLDRLRTVVLGDDRWRWLELGCSLGAGGGDELSDADVGIGYADTVEVEGLEGAAMSVVTSLDAPIDAIVHRLDGWPQDVCRVAAENGDEVQLDLVMMPAASRPGVPDRTVVLVDKDDHSTQPYEPLSRRPPLPATARRWLFLGWWALSAADNYAVRGSWFEAVEALGEARKHALSLYAAGHDVPYPTSGLVSLLDFPPYAVPEQLADTYCTPADPSAVRAALHTCATLLRQAADSAASRLGTSLNSSLADATTRRLAQH